MKFVLLQHEDPVTEGIRRLQEGFRQESSLGPVLWSCVGIVVATIIVLLIARVQRRKSGDFVPNDPKRLFQSLMDRLELSEGNRSLLESMAREMRLKHPAVLLLAPAVFDRAAQLWSARSQRFADAHRDRIASLRRSLFPG
jgi:hypothetical protein